MDHNLGFHKTEVIGLTDDHKWHNELVRQGFWWRAGMPGEKRFGRHVIRHYWHPTRKVLEAITQAPIF